MSFIVVSRFESIQGTVPAPALTDKEFCAHARVAPGPERARARMRAISKSA